LFELLQLTAGGAGMVRIIVGLLECVDVTGALVRDRVTVAVVGTTG
jgi:hypothetical protein